MVKHSAAERSAILRAYRRVIYRALGRARSRWARDTNTRWILRRSEAIRLAYALYSLNNGTAAQRRNGESQIRWFVEKLDRMRVKDYYIFDKGAFRHELNFLLANE